jgi:hypothetical protein
MNTRLVLVLGALGLSATFLPQEIASYLGVPATGALPLMIQLLGALYFSFALLNWTAKASLIGGIYNRPIAIGNLVHFTMGALALGKGALANPSIPMILPFAIGYAIFAIAFAWIFFTSPVQSAPSS